MKILIIEDERDMAKTLRDNLRKEYILDIAFSGEDGLYQAEINNYDLILLDYILPGISGLDVIKTLRKEEIFTPILIVTANNDMDKRINCLSIGSDDYITKPVHLPELKARIRAVLRRAHQKKPTNIISIADLQVDIAAKVVERNGQTITLRRKEFELLEYFILNAGKVLTRTMILDHIWDSSYDSFTNIVDVHINYLRSHIDKPFPKKLIKTVHGIGYKLEA